MSGMDAQRVTEVAAALSAPARARIACALLSGTAHTGRELARHLKVAPSTASEHLGQLTAAGLVHVERQGRHRYYRLAGPEVADLLETLMAVPPDVAPVATPALPAGLAFARSCYDHLAGELGVGVYDGLVTLDAIRVGSGAAALTGSGRDLLGALGIALPARATRPAVRPCLDWSQRRHHLAGTVGAALLDVLLTRRWLHRNPHRRRELRLTDTGRRQLRAHLGMEPA